MKLRVVDACLYRRTVPFRLPFHVAGTTITGVDQFHARVTVETASGRRAEGVSAESPSPIWFDKVRPAETVMADIVTSLRRTARRYLDTPATTAFALFADGIADQQGWARTAGAPATVAQFGPALWDRAVLDALCRALEVDIFTALRGNAPGLSTAPCGDLAGFDADTWLSARHPLAALPVRHTIGGDDPLVAADIRHPIGDGLPESLDAILAAYGNRSFKIKVGPDIPPVLARLRRIAAVLDTLPAYAVTLDGNEQFQDAEGVAALVAAIAAEPALARLRAGLRYIEQPIHRDRVDSVPVHAVPMPLLVDESEGTPDAFAQAHDLGWRGVSSKSCKGVYQALLNGMRCTRWDDGSFVIAEDLNHPAGLSLQQDLAIAAFLGVADAERNGHHYMNGMAAAPAAEQAAYLAAHADLYASADGVVRLAIRDGALPMTGLHGTGFAHAAWPDWASLDEVPLNPA
jgi:hypothetical protein